MSNMASCTLLDSQILNFDHKINTIHSLQKNLQVATCMGLIHVANSLPHVISDVWAA
jgi:hypothetical protein